MQTEKNHAMDPGDLVMMCVGRFCIGAIDQRCNMKLPWPYEKRCTRAMRLIVRTQLHGWHTSYAYRFLRNPYIRQRFLQNLFGAGY
jgi:hypothetical protein